MENNGSGLPKFNVPLAKIQPFAGRFAWPAALGKSWTVTVRSAECLPAAKPDVLWGIN